MNEHHEMRKINPGTKRPDRRLNKSTGPHLRRKEDGLDILDDMGDGVYRINSEGYFTFMNKALVERLGIAPEQYRRIHYLELIDPQYHAKARKNVQRIMGGMEGIPYELKHNGANGQIRIVEVYSRSIHEGEKIVGLFGISRDVTKRKLVEEELHKSQELYGKLISTIPDVIIQTDMSARIVLINDVGVQLSGYSSAEEIEGRDLLSFIIPEDRKKANENLSRQLQRRIGPTLYSMITRDGRRITMEVNGDVLRDTDEVPYGRVFICRDITERKQVEEELERHRNLLEDMVKERTAELEIKNITLQEVNMALKVLLKQREDDKKDLEERFVMNVGNLILPFVEQMKKWCLDAGQRAYLDIIETHLHNIATPLLKNIRQFNLTPKEIKVAVLVKEGKSTKEIAEILGIATGSIDIHRKNIRKKLELSNRKANLQSYLASLEQ